MWTTVCGLLFLSILSYTHCFYVPGVAPVEFHQGDRVELKGVKMTSTKTQLPYEYYSVKFCRPNNTVEYKAENLGEILRGDRIVNTPYEVRMKVNSCKKLCQVSLNKADADFMIRRIKNDYAVHLLADNLPAATRFTLPDSTPQYEHGYRLGQFSKDKKVFINNHLRIILLYHTDDEVNHRIVGFEVKAFSLGNVKFDNEKACYDSVASKSSLQELIGDGNDKVTFSYEVHWQSSEIRWASRWDTYLKMTDVEVHWFSIINSIVVIFFLSGILTMIIIRTLRRDIAKYNRDDDVEETLEESGWKLVHGDVFRPPKYTRFLVALIGSGIQLLCMVFVTILFAMLGMLSPASRGALMSAGIFVYVFTGIFAGYFSGRLYKTLRGQLWKTAALWTGTLFPSLILGMSLFLNFFLWGKKSSGAVPFTTMLAILALWMCVLLPLVFIGFYFGYRKYPYEHPVRTNQIPRAVPELKWYHNIFVSNLISGILPFGVVFIELFFIFSAIWEKQFYYLFGFLFIVFIILIITCSQIAIVMVYFQLCGEDYHWWWRSFIVSGGSAFYVFCYAIFYFVKKLQITEFIPTLLYFGYTLLMVFAFWVLTGTIGFYAAYWFIRRIYAAIKID